MTKKVSAVDVKKKVVKVKKDSPFATAPLARPYPMNPRDRQKAWILSGLKHLGAPIAAGLPTC